MSLKATMRDLVEDARTRVPEIDHATLRTMRNGSEPPLLIDVRESDEWDAARIPGAVHVSRGVLERDVVSACFNGSVKPEDLERPIVCYCGGGSRSLLAAEQLRRMGFEGAVSLAGGFREWQEAGGGVEM